MEQYMSTFNNTLLEVLELNGMSDFSSRADKLEALYKALVETNKLYNLTAVTDELGVSALHFADSLMAMPYIYEFIGKNGELSGKKALDIGCGAGFPCLPIAISAPEMTVNGVDSTAKKVDFSNKFAASIGLDGFSSIAARAEELAGTEMREAYDFVTARAVSRLNVLCELALPFVKEGGYFLAMKGSKGAEEYEEAKNGIEILGGKLIRLDEKELILPSEAQKRTLILIKKVRSTDKKYPRMYSKIVKSPLK